MHVNGSLAYVFLRGQTQKELFNKNSKDNDYRHVGRLVAIIRGGI